MRAPSTCDTSGMVHEGAARCAVRGRPHSCPRLAGPCDGSVDIRIGKNASDSFRAAVNDHRFHFHSVAGQRHGLRHLPPPRRPRRSRDAATTYAAATFHRRRPVFEHYVATHHGGRVHPVTYDYDSDDETQPWLPREERRVLRILAERRGEFASWAPRCAIQKAY